ncbi:MAG: zinc-binding dehydrogenase [Actinomycetaceae bacterium]|nr:zinc-binding dehydrogenase [Arcanobacterium sp.]MDD7504485.1 zinc-binding dehydrogenase [Actinomycetaceae bacterium]MDY6142845.1 zinc-binding dehydrogenase [Arcanobacterium sp.]
MRGAYFTTTGNPDVITIGELPEPDPRAGEVKIRVIAVSVNRVDTYIRAGKYRTELSQPALIGRDAIGEIVAIGDGVSLDRFDSRRGVPASVPLVWTNSMGYDGRQGVAAQYICVPQERLYPAPTNVYGQASEHTTHAKYEASTNNDDSQGERGSRMHASSSPHPISAHEFIACVHSAATAAIVLNSVMRVRNGERLLVEGAGGHVGTKFTELAAARGLDVYTTSNPRDFERLAALGASHTFDYADPDLFTTLARATQDATAQPEGHHRNQDATPTVPRPGGFAHIVDTSGRVPFARNLDLLGIHGEMTMITPPPDHEAGLDLWSFYTSSKQLNGFVISHASTDQLSAAARVINDAVDNGMLLGDPVDVLPLSEAARAHERVESGHERSRIVLTL